MAWKLESNRGSAGGVAKERLILEGAKTLTDQPATKEMDFFKLQSLTLNRKMKKQKRNRRHSHARARYRGTLDG